MRVSISWIAEERGRLCCLNAKVIVCMKTNSFIVFFVLCRENKNKISGELDVFG